MTAATAIAKPKRAIVMDDPQLHYWGDIFVKAGLYPFLRFEEFMRDPEAFVRAITDQAAPAPASLPQLRARIRAWVEWHNAGNRRRQFNAQRTPQ